MREGKAKLDKYIIAGKTGTAQVARLIDDKYCAYVCTSQKGLFDQSCNIRLICNPIFKTLLFMECFPIQLAIITTAI